MIKLSFCWIFCSSLMLVLTLRCSSLLFNITNLYTGYAFRQYRLLSTCVLSKQNKEEEAMKEFFVLRNGGVWRLYF